MENFNLTKFIGKLYKSVFILTSVISPMLFVVGILIVIDSSSTSSIYRDGIFLLFSPLMPLLLHFLKKWVLWLIR